MHNQLTVQELENRWENVLTATRTAVSKHPLTYRELKFQAAEIVQNTIDINDYFPAVEKLVDRLEALDPCGRESIFHIFKVRISPSNIWQVKLLRMECKDLLAHLTAFDHWRRKKHRLRRVK